MPQQLTTSLFFFFNDTATTEIYTLSLHDALPISVGRANMKEGTSRCSHRTSQGCSSWRNARNTRTAQTAKQDRKSTRLNSSHGYISYAVFCLKKKKKLSVVRITTKHNITRA